MSQVNPSLTLTLKDGRKLGYAILAAPNVSQAAPTVLYFHGWPGSHPEGGMLKTSVMQRQMRLVTLSRPGFGESSLKPDLTHLDWANDVLEFTKSLNIQQFYILGFLEEVHTRLHV